MTNTLPKTNISPLKIGHPKRKQSYSNYPFLGVNSLASFQGEDFVYSTIHPAQLHPLKHGLASPKCCESISSSLDMEKRWRNMVKMTHLSNVVCIGRFSDIIFTEIPTYISRNMCMLCRVRNRTYQPFSSDKRTSYCFLLHGSITT